jgi:sortase A
MKKISKKKSTIILVILFLAGLSLLLYPTVSDYWNSLHASRVISSYASEVANMTAAERQEMLDEAAAFNEKLASRGSFGALSDIEQDEYYSLLGGPLDVISTITIPAINCTLPIYHGTDEFILDAGVGHLEGSSLPVGGESTHCVLSGHRGLPSARLFTDLDQLAEGDIFILQTLGETLTYEVDQIRIVLPEDTSELSIVPGEDYVTLVTCTPYGVNTHRLLVRGHRIENLSGNDYNVTADAVQLDPLVVAPFAAVPILLVMLFLVLRMGKGKNKRNRKNDQTEK